jgi:hypothetical protein
MAVTSKNQIHVSRTLEVIKSRMQNRSSSVIVNNIPKRLVLLGMFGVKVLEVL